MKKRNGQHSVVVAPAQVPASAPTLVTPAVEDPVVSSSIKVLPAEREELQQTDKDIGRLKIELADIEVLIAQLQAKKMALIGQALGLQEKLGARLAIIAKGYGIDPVDATKGRWTYDLPVGSFTKVSAS